MSATSLLLKVIKFRATGKFKRQYWIKVENYTMKYHAVIVIHYYLDIQWDISAYIFERVKIVRWLH